MTRQKYDIDRLCEVAENPIQLDGSKAFVVGSPLEFPSSDRLMQIMKDLNTQVLHDELTGFIRQGKAEEVFNKTLVSLNLEQLKEEKQGLVFIRIDIDGFKEINDCYGHLVGDDMISIFSQVLLSELRGSQFVARAGGDEFIVVLPVVPLFCLNKIICRIYESFQKKLQQEMQGTVVGGVQFSSGVVFWPYSTNIPGNFFKKINKQADLLQLVAKKDPKGYLVSLFKDTET